MDWWLSFLPLEKGAGGEQVITYQRGSAPSPANLLDGTVVRVPKTYPAYFGTYDRFPELRRHLDTLENLFLSTTVSKSMKSVPSGFMEGR